MQIYFLFNKIKSKIKKNTEIFALTLLIILTISFTTYYNYSKKKNIQQLCKYNKQCLFKRNNYTYF